MTADQMSENKLSGVTQVPERHAIHIELQLSPDECLKLDGEVIYKVERLGFGVLFLNVATHDEQVLNAFIDKQEVGSLDALAFPRVRGNKH